MEFLVRIPFILLILLGLLLIIAIHEFGHMIVAKMFNIGVVEYSIGMGPVIWTKRKTETCYSLRAIPFGGYCAIYGESDDADDEDVSKKDDKYKHHFWKKPDYKLDWDDSRKLCARPWWQRFFVYIAGAAFNVISAVLLVFLLLGINLDAYGPMQVTEIVPGSVAEVQGIMPGDLIVGINGGMVETYEDYSEYLFAHANDVQDGFTLQINRNNEILNIPVHLGEDGLLGFSYDSLKTDASFAKWLKYVGVELRYQFRMVFDSLKMLFSNIRNIKDMSGFLGIMDAGSNLLENLAENGVLVLFRAFLYIVIMLSVNIGLLNLLPLPALDGGHLIICLFEGISGKQLRSDIYRIVNSVGMLVLLLFVGFVFVNDLIRIIGNLFV